MNTFVWADLSTFDLRSAKDFYRRCFGWKYYPWDGDYHLCESSGAPSAGLFTMPQKFQAINMPSFWMSYIQVQDIEQTVIKAKEHGAKIEVKPEPGPGGGTIALIRDPAGAGFTCYQGEAPSGKDPAGQHGAVAWNELHVSDLAKVKAFYENTFGWFIQPTNTPDRYEIFTSPDTPHPIAGIQVTSNTIKGDKEYWGVYFPVNDLTKVTKTIENAGGSTHQAQPLGNQPSLLAYDSQGAAFYLLQGNNRDTPHATKPFKWRAMLGLILVAIAILTEANWIWGLFFLFWIIPDIRTGSTHFLEHIQRRTNPIIFWLIVAIWSALSIYLLLEPLMAR